MDNKIQISYIVDNKEINLLVREEIAIFMKEDKRRVSSSNRQVRRKNSRYYDEFHTDNKNVLDIIMEAYYARKQKEHIETLYKGLELLTDKQLDRVYMYFVEGLNYEEIARLEGVHRANIYKSIQTSIEKIKKLF